MAREHVFWQGQDLAAVVAREKIAEEGSARPADVQVSCTRGRTAVVLVKPQGSCRRHRAIRSVAALKLLDSFRAKRKWDTPVGDGAKRVTTGREGGAIVSDPLFPRGI